jgi:N-acetylglucosaminyl-diphospho-decaprenol L-rhamnosyltransferase
MKVSIIIITRNTREITLGCLRSLEEVMRVGKHEVVVVDNASSDGTADAIAARYPQVRLLREPQNEGFARANNYAARETDGDLLFFLNSDTLASAAAVEGLAAALCADPRLGAVGPRLIYGDGRPQDTAHYQVTMATEITSAARRRARQKVAEAVARGEDLAGLAFLSGAALMMRREVFAALSGFDESFFFYFEDNDLCKRLADRGWGMRVAREVTVTHFGGGTGESARKPVELARARCQYLRKHYGLTSAFAILGKDFLTRLQRAVFSLLYTLLTLGCYRRVRDKAIVNLQLCLWFLLFMPGRESRLYRTFFGDWQG